MTRGVDIDRAAEVRARVCDALAELRDVRCADHAAAHAIRAVKLTEQTLTYWWLPLLDRVAPPGDQ